MRFSRKNLGIPYAVFLLLFVVAPLIVIVIYAFTNGQGQFTLENLTGFFTDPNTMGTLFYSLAIAFVTTVVCLLLAYPIAYILAMSELKTKSVIIMVFVLPMWINFSLRITALKEVLTLIEGNLARYPFTNAVVGITYDFLPFMILPIYTTLSKLDGALREAAMDLGADDLHTFLQVTLPLSVPGIVSGVSMVFLPAMTNYVVLDMLYNSTYIMGSLIGSYFSAYNWHGGSMIALILLAIICHLSPDPDPGCVQFYKRHSDRSDQGLLPAELCDAVYYAGTDGYDPRDASSGSGVRFSRDDPGNTGSDRSILFRKERVAGHVTLCAPFVFLSVMPKIKQMDSSIYEAALDLGATPLTALFEIVIPQIVPGIVSGFALAITLSLDDYFISTYTKPAMFDTISTYVVNATKGSQTTIKTALWALSTVIFAVVVLIVIGMNVRALQKEGGSHAKK